MDSDSMTEDELALLLRQARLARSPDEAEAAHSSSAASTAGEGQGAEDVRAVQDRVARARSRRAALHRDLERASRRCRELTGKIPLSSPADSQSGRLNAELEQRKAVLGAARGRLAAGERERDEGKARVEGVGAEQREAEAARAAAEADLQLARTEASDAFRRRASEVAAMALLQEMTEFDIAEMARRVQAEQARNARVQEFCNAMLVQIDTKLKSWIQ
eukprot:m51a1_g5276 hypothetical protein (219) ;mRNA; r:158389-159315